MKSRGALAGLLVALLAGAAALAVLLRTEREDADLRGGAGPAREPEAPSARLAPGEVAAEEPELRLAPPRLVLDGTPLGTVHDPRAPEARTGATGRVVDELGAPVPGIEVVLYELPADVVDRLQLGELEPPQRDGTTTDRGGRFTLRGARVDAQHALGLEPGGPRGVLRPLGVALARDELTDVGDVALAPVTVVTGAVVDAAGRPVAGARVRVADVPAELVPLGRLGAGGLLALGEGPPLPPSRWVRSSIDRLPVPTVFTGADGRFRLERAARGTPRLLVDAPDRPALGLGPLRTGDAALELGTLALPAERDVRVTVRGAAGEAVAAAEVRVGAVASLFASLGGEAERADVIYGEPLEVDPSGRFRARGVSADDGLVVAARRRPGEAWTFAGPFEADPLPLDVDLVLPAGATLVLLVRDTAGDAVEGATVAVRPADGWARNAGPTALVLGASQPRLVPPREADGRFRVAGLAPGRYQVEARAPGYAANEVRIDLLEQDVERPIELALGIELTVTVVDAETGEPVPGALVSVVTRGDLASAPRAAAETDASGRARFDRLALSSQHENEILFGAGRQLGVRVEHFGHVPQEVALRHRGELRVELESPGSIAGRLTVAGAAPPRPLTVLVERFERVPLERRQRALRTTRTSADGSYRVGGLPPGPYRLEVHDELPGRVLAGLEPESRPQSLVRREIGVQAGRTTPVSIDLGGGTFEARAVLRGVVHVRGAPLVGGEVVLTQEEPARAMTDGSGRFELGGVWPDRELRLTIDGDVPLPGGATPHLDLLDERLVLGPGEVRELVLELWPVALEVRVEDERGEPVGDAAVFVSSAAAGAGRASFYQETGELGLGRASFVLAGPGRWRVQAHHDELVSEARIVDVPAAGLAEPVRVVLGRGVTVSGRIVPPRPIDPREAPYLLVIEEQGGENAHSRSVPVDVETLEFELVGLRPGVYTAYVGSGGLIGNPTTLRVGAQDMEDVVLTLEPLGGPAAR